MTTHITSVSLVLWLALVSQGQVIAQKPKETERHYRAGVRLLQMGDYDRARTEFQPVMQIESSFAPFAYYYTADAHFRQKRYDATRTTAKQLIDKFPNWLKKEEVYYLAAAAAMEQALYDEGLSYANLIAEPDLRDDVERMELHFLPRISDLNRLKGLQKQYPQDKILARTLVDLIQRTSTDKDDLELSDRLSNRYGIVSTPANNTRPAPATPVATPPPPTARPDRVRQKGYYNVGILFPFRLNRFNPAERVRSNQYVYDLYEGMKLAKAKLMAEGITVNLFTYDLENDADQALELINNPSFLQNDLLIGPLYTEPNRLVAEFAEQNNLVIVNPIATSRELINNRPNAWLAQPSTLMQARETARFAQEASNVRRAAVYFGSARKDSLLATAYAAELKAQGTQVVDFKRLTGKAAEMAAAMNFTDDARPGHVFFAGSNDDDGPRLLDALSRRNVPGPLITTYPAFDYFRNSLSTFTRRELYLLAPEFMDLSRPATVEFQETYLSKRSSVPSTFAAQGYDMLLFFGRQLAKGTLKNRPLLKTEAEQDYVLSGFDYTQANDNQTVPIIKFDGERFIKVN